MEKTTLKSRIKSEIENLISNSCTNPQSTKIFEPLHVALLKKHYNAADVSIDYHRKRITMDIVMDDKLYDPTKANTGIPLLHANLLFNNLKDFLKSCVVMAPENIGFYAGLLRQFAKKEVILTIV
ncbi:hypothetical protein [Maribacter polysaccharolyticus]|uniref:hypothetical protein n=1 Tax=Maribacter polysaccharolyticus TaxID=3020831 RepID=UPI00237F2AC7|nr:hypothetical protein [Maribacter polysaccharolyticus]MDE3742420.1 hypothetical protein [Maribacter polysaccharolyticus]